MKYLYFPYSDILYTFYVIQLVYLSFIFLIILSCT